MTNYCGGDEIMGTIRARRVVPSMLAVALAGCLLAGCSLEQILPGQWYGIVTPPSGACPRLEWRFVVDPQRSISGVLSGDDRQRIADLSGQLGPDDSFRMTATAPGTGRRASVTGRFTAQVSTLSIHGDAAGAGCDGQTFSLRLGGYFARQGGGGGGGR